MWIQDARQIKRPGPQGTALAHNAGTEWGDCTSTCQRRRWQETGGHGQSTGVQCRLANPTKMPERSPQGRGNGFRGVRIFHEFGVVRSAALRETYAPDCRLSTTMKPITLHARLQSASDRADRTPCNTDVFPAAWHLQRSATCHMKALHGEGLACSRERVRVLVGGANFGPSDACMHASAHSIDRCHACIKNTLWFRVAQERMRSFFLHIRSTQRKRPPEGGRMLHDIDDDDTQPSSSSTAAA